MWRADSLKKTLMLVKTEEKGSGRGWDGYIVSATQWTWIWANSGKQQKTEQPDVLQSMGSPRVRHNLATEQQWLINSELFHSQISALTVVLGAGGGKRCILLLSSLFFESSFLSSIQGSSSPGSGQGDRGLQEKSLCHCPPIPQAFSGRAPTGHSMLFFKSKTCATKQNTEFTEKEKILKGDRDKKDSLC